MANKKKNHKKSGKQQHSAVLAFLIKHSLSLVLLGIVIVLKIIGAFLPPGYWYDTFNGFGDDAWGALLIVIATKYFIESGSAESKE